MKLQTLVVDAPLPSGVHFFAASNNKVVRVPKGFSAYQARWITDESGEVFSDFEGSEDEEMDEFVVDSMGAVVSQEGGPSKPSAHGNALRKGRGGASSSMAVDSSEEDEEDSDVAEDSAGEGDMGEQPHSYTCMHTYTDILLSLSLFPSPPRLSVGPDGCGGTRK